MRLTNNSWEVYHYSLAGAIGWDFPACKSRASFGLDALFTHSIAFDLDEITTPWPRDSYDDVGRSRSCDHPALVGRL